MAVQTDVVSISIALGVVLLVDVGGARRGDVPPPRSLNAGPHGVLLYHDLEYALQAWRCYSNFSLICSPCGLFSSGLLTRQTAF